MVLENPEYEAPFKASSMKTDGSSFPALKASSDAGSLDSI
jgi:hypothetical protein